MLRHLGLRLQWIRHDINTSSFQPQLRRTEQRCLLQQCCSPKVFLVFYCWLSSQNGLKSSYSAPHMGLSDSLLQNAPKIFDQLSISVMQFQSLIIILKARRNIL